MKTRLVLLAVLVLLLVLLVQPPVLAHQDVHINGLDVTIGWAVEPAIAGEPNAPQIRVEDEDGAPVTGLKLSIEVGFSGKVSEKKLLEPAFGEPGLYETDLIPTRPGVYTFHITGTLGGKPMDRTFTAGENTFSEVEQASALQFPEQDPTAGDLAARAETTETRLEAVKVGATSAGDDASRANMLGWIGIGFGLFGTMVGLAGIRRKAA